MRFGLKVLLASDAIFLLAAGMLGPIYALYVEEVGGDLLAASSTWAIFMFVSGIVIFFVSRWEDHIKHKERLVLSGYILRSLGFLGYIFVANIYHLFLVQVILGAGASIGTPAYDAMYSKLLDRGKFASEWGLWESMYTMVTAAAAITGGLLATIYGFRSLLIAMFLFSLVGLGIVGYFIKRLEV